MNIRAAKGQPIGRIFKIINSAKRLLRPMLFWRSNYKDKKFYSEWLNKNFLTGERLEFQRKRSERFDYRPLVSIIVPTYNTPEIYFREMIRSVFDQTYSNWELILVDDASPDGRVRELIEEYANRDKRIKYKFLDKNNRIAGATNEGIKIASGEYIALFDHDDILSRDALFEVVKALNDNKKLEFIYTDEDKISASGDRHYQPMIKPDWNPDFLRSVNYITHFVVIKKGILDRFGYEDSNYDGTQDWELFLRITRNITADCIHHIPKILYSWRVHDGSTAKAIEVKPYVVDAQRRALEADVQARGLSGVEVERDPIHGAQWRLVFDMPGSARVSVVVNDPKTAARVRAFQKEQSGSFIAKVIEIDQRTMYKELFKQITGDYAVFIEGRPQLRDLARVKDMFGDAQRGEIGMVLAKCSDDVVMKNLTSILSGEAVEFMRRISRRMVIKHLYLTARYNIRTIHGGVAMVGVKKLRRACPADEYVSLLTASKALAGAGYHNLYNPYVEVLK